MGGHEGDGMVLKQNAAELRSAEQLECKGYLSGVRNFVYHILDFKHILEFGILQYGQTSWTVHGEDYKIKVFVKLLVILIDNYPLIICFFDPIDIKIVFKVFMLYLF